jgi:hypothetical protein
VQRRTFIRFVIATLAVSVLAGGPLGAMPSPSATPAQGNPSCIAQCRAQHNQCRMTSRGSSSCDAQLQSCLQSCLRR